MKSTSGWWWGGGVAETELSSPVARAGSWPSVKKVQNASIRGDTNIS